MTVTAVATPKTSEVRHKGTDVKITYEQSQVDNGGTTLRLFTFTADKDCILYFSNLSDFGINTLVLQADVPRFFALPDVPVNIQFQVYSPVEYLRSVSDPPPIHP